MIIIGITGTLGSGKGTVVEYLKNKYGFKHYSASKYISEELAKQGMEKTRDNMRVLANSLRAQYGGNYVAEQLYNQAAAKGGNAVIESLRATGEIESLRQKPGHFYLLSVDADPKVRYTRILGRNSTKDNISFDKFMEQEAQEMHDTSPGGMNIADCMQMADGHVTNDGNIDQLHSAIDKIIKPLIKTPLE